MKVIWKYKLNDEDIYVPRNSKVLCVKLQYGVPCVWILIDAYDESLNLLQFRVVETEEEFDNTDIEYVGTYEEGPSIWHVFEVIK